MSKHTALTAQARAKAGKGAARAVRREKRVPAVIYGDSKEPVLISLLEKDLVKVASESVFYTSICELEVDGKKHSVIPRDIQLHPVNDRPLHADFLRVTDKTMISISVPVNVINHKDCPGVSKGGVINMVRHEVEVNCSAKDMPEEFVVDLTGMDVGSSVHISDLELPKGVVPVNAEKLTVLTIVAPSSLKSEETAEIAAGEGEGEEVAAEGEAAPAEEAK